MQQHTDTAAGHIPLAEIISRLEGDGWSFREDVACLADGRLAWTVAGRNGSRSARSRGATMAEAWAAVADRVTRGCESVVNPTDDATLRGRPAHPLLATVAGLIPLAEMSHLADHPVDPKFWHLAPTPADREVGSDPGHPSRPRCHARRRGRCRVAGSGNAPLAARFRP